jgi:argininosuccinate lyase
VRKRCESLGIDLHELIDEDFIGIHPLLTSDIRDQLSAKVAVSSRNSLLGTATESLINQLSELTAENNNAKRWIGSERERFSGMMIL